MNTRDALAYAFLALLLGFLAGIVVYLGPDGYEGPQGHRATLTDRPAGR